MLNFVHRIHGIPRLEFVFFFNCYASCVNFVSEHEGSIYGEHRYTRQQRDDELFELIEKFGDLRGCFVQAD